MANTKSAQKRIRTSERNRLRNRAVRSALRTSVKKFREAVDAGDLTSATKLLREAHAEIDRSAKKSVVHRRTAARSKSRLALAHAKLASAKKS
jgi:small subunit ribosomal protein S20